MISSSACKKNISYPALLSYVAIGVVTGTLLIILPLAIYITLAVGIVAMYFIAKKPELGVLAIVVLISSIIFENSLPLVPIGIGSLHISDLLLFYLLGLIFFRWFSGRGKIVKSPLNLPLILFYVIAILSAVISIQKYGNDFNYVIRFLRPLTYYLLFFVVLNLVRDTQRLRFLVKGLFAIGVVVAIAMVIQSIVGESVQLMPGRIEQSGTLDADFNVLRLLPPGQTLIYLLFIIAITMSASVQWRASLRVFGVSVLLVLGVGVLLTYNRTYWVATALACLMLLCMLTVRARRQAFAVAVLTMGIGACGLVLFGGGRLVEETAHAVQARVMSLTTVKELRESGPIEDRHQENGYAIKQILRAPLFGTGLGANYRPLIYDPKDDLTYYVHNGYLWLIKDMGIVGAAAFAWFYGGFIVRWFRTWKSTRDDLLSPMVLGSGLAVLGTLPMVLLNPLFMQWYSIVVLATVMGIAESTFSLRVQKEER